MTSCDIVRETNENLLESRPGSGFSSSFHFTCQLVTTAVGALSLLSFPWEAVLVLFSPPPPAGLLPWALRERPEQTHRPDSISLGQRLRTNFLLVDLHPSHLIQLWFTPPPRQLQLLQISHSLFSLFLFFPFPAISFFFSLLIFLFQSLSFLILPNHPPLFPFS